MPCLRQNSATGTPASCSFKIPMLCSSENRDRFIRPVLSSRPDSSTTWRNYRGSQQLAISQIGHLKAGLRHYAVARPRHRFVKAGGIKRRPLNWLILNRSIALLPQSAVVYLPTHRLANFRLRVCRGSSSAKPLLAHRMAHPHFEVPRSRQSPPTRLRPAGLCRPL